jgi:hypothetical protein
MELGDAVENDGYAITPALNAHPVHVSNFLLPSWFDAQPPHGARFDYMGKLKAPFTMDAGGYVITMVNGEVSQQFADGYPEWKKPGKLFAASRTTRRG